MLRLPMTEDVPAGLLFQFQDLFAQVTAVEGRMGPGDVILIERP